MTIYDLPPGLLFALAVVACWAALIGLSELVIRVVVLLLS